MRRIVAITVLMVAGWQIFGFSTFFELESRRIRKEIKSVIKHSISESNLIEFNFTKKELKELTWIKLHEFKLNKHLFDVVYKFKTKKGYRLLCINDVQETVLFAKLDTSTFDNLVSDSPIKQWLKILENPLILDSEKVEYALIQLPLEKTKVYSKNTQFSNLKLEIVLPPPQNLG